MAPKKKAAGKKDPAPKKKAAGKKTAGRKKKSLEESDFIDSNTEMEFATIESEDGESIPCALDESETE